MPRQRVAVLAGGLSHEREVSLRSGRRVRDALIAAGVDTTLGDVDAQLMAWLAAERPDCVIPMLHGEVGEDGALGEILELSGVAYVGSTPAAARVAFDKPIAKQVISRAGLNTPESVALAADTFRELGAAAVLSAVVDRLGLPLIVKPAKGGSALGVSVVITAEQLPTAMMTCFSYGDTALVEQCIIGVEVAVPVVEGGHGVAALPAVEIRPDGGLYDYTARYTAGATEFVVPAEVDAATSAECARVAVAAHEVLGLRDLSRSDLIVDGHGVVWFLEVNVAPGMTETSLLPLAAEAAGLDIGSLFSTLTHRAAKRRKSI